jgi:chorismate dehydratase
MIKISIVNYTNTLPFKWALKKSTLFAEIDLQEDIPSICAQKLKFNQVDLALVPVALLTELPNYFIETDYCIAADGNVDSVKLYSQVPLNEIKTIKLDYQSKSSITLTKVLSKFYWKINPQFIDAQVGYEHLIKGTNAAVVIGDRTFALNNTFKYEYDLAYEWKLFTGLPFVFAAWVSTKKINTEFILKFNAVLKEGVDNTLQAISESKHTLVIDKDVAADYLTKKIMYTLTENKRQGMGLFLNYYKKLYEL